MIMYIIGTYREESWDKFVNWFSCLKLNLLLCKFLKRKFMAMKFKNVKLTYICNTQMHSCQLSGFKILRFHL